MKTKFNKNLLLNGTFFLAGSVIGGIVGGLIAKKATEEKCDKEMDILRDIYLDKVEVASAWSDEELMTEEEMADLLDFVENDEIDRREKLLKNWDKPPLKSTSEFEKDLAESEHPLDSDEDESDNAYFEDEVRADNDSADIHGYYEEHKNDPPKILSDEESGDINPGVEVVEWTYFAKDDTMVDGDDQIVPDFRRFVGHLLDDSGWIDDTDADDINILSTEYMNLYKITKLYRKFSDMDAAHHQVYDELNAAYS